MSESILKLLGNARWLILPVLLCCALSMQAHAQNDNTATTTPTQAEQPRPGEGDMKFLPALDLSDEQRTQLVAIARQHQQDLAVAQMRLRQARRALNQAIYAENPEQNIVSERARDVATAQESLTRLNAQTELKVRQLLTPEQLKRFRELRRRQREERIGSRPEGEQRRLPRERFPNPNRPSATQSNGDNNNTPPAEVLRERRRLRRHLPNGGRRP